MKPKSKNKPADETSGPLFIRKVPRKLLRDLKAAAALAGTNLQIEVVQRLTKSLKNTKSVEEVVDTLPGFQP